MPSSADVTALLARAQQGDHAAQDALVQATYDELRGLARGQLQQQRRDHTLQATALVHEVYARMLAGQALPGKNRVQFLAYAAQAMRRILINYARDRARNKRGGAGKQVPLEEDMLVAGRSPEDLIALDEALEHLARIAPRKSRVVELRFFGGLTVEEVAQVLEVSPRTVKRDWEIAGTLLMRALSRGESDGS